MSLFPLKQEEADPAGASKKRRARTDSDAHEPIVARLDTGASCHDFVSKAVADGLIARGAKVMPITGRVCSAFKAEGRKLSSKLICKYSFINMLSQKEESVVIEPVILEDLSAPLIVGLQTIGANGLLLKQLPDLCGRIRDQEHCVSRLHQNGLLGGSGGALSLAGETAADLEELTQEQGITGIPAPGVKGKPPRATAKGKGGLTLSAGLKACELCTLQVSSRDFFRDDDDGEDISFQEGEPASISDLLPSRCGGGGAFDQPVTSELIAKIIFGSDPDLQQDARVLCKKYVDIFAETVRAQAAHVPPMSLEVDADKLRRAGKRSPRPQSQQKLIELKKMVEELLKLGVIRVSTADVPASQVLLVAKKGTTKLRFCIDFRAINEATIAPEKWPIPNI